MNMEILTIIGTGIGIVTFLYTVMRNFKSDMNMKFDKMDEKLTDIDRRLCRLEGAFSARECCMLNNERNDKNIG